MGKNYILESATDNDTLHANKANVIDTRKSDAGMEINTDINIDAVFSSIIKL